MIDKKASKNLYDFAVALLIGQGEFEQTREGIILTTPFERKKSLYLTEILKNEQLVDYIEINTKKGQFKIHPHSILSNLKERWFQENDKIFSLVLDPKLLSLKSIVMCINLFGERKLESINIPTNIDKNHIKTLSYCIEQNLKVPVIPGTNQFKITNITKLMLSSVNEIPAIHSAELVNLLTEKEKKKLIMEGAR